MEGTTSTLDELLQQAVQALDADANADAGRLVNEALTCAAQTGAKAYEVRALLLAATLAERSADFPLAARHVGQAQSLARELHDASLNARVATASAQVFIAIGDFETALKELEAALPLAEAEDEPLLRFHAENRLGVVYANLEDPLHATLWHERARQTARRLPSRRQEIMAMGNIGGRQLDLGVLHRAAGRSREATLAFEASAESTRQALLLAEAAALPSLRVTFIPNLASALHELGRVDEALAQLDQHRALARASGTSLAEIYSMTCAAQIHLDRGDLDAARQAADEGIALAESLGSRHGTDRLYETAFKIEKQAGQFERALAHHERFHQLSSGQALVRANQRAQVLAVRLDTERARAEAQQERLRAESLLRSNFEMAERERLLSREALLDPLTGLANRRHLDAELARMHLAARQASMPMCVAMLDVDHFKHVNDDFSHAVGDAVLRELGRVLQAQCRGGDLVARYGGEEFTVAFSRIDLLLARVACERLRAAVEAVDWGAIARGLKVTISVGVVDIAACTDPATGLALADQRLYAAKAAGRNRVDSGS